MIGFRDFAPKQLSTPMIWAKLLSPRDVSSKLGTFESFDKAVQAANDWIAAEHIDVVNVETVVLPLYSSANLPEAGTAAPCVLVIVGNLWYASVQFVRVWYRLPNP